jgi:hypothetical protein
LWKNCLEDETKSSWVPLDEYYYGRKEGDPTYREEKGEFKFKVNNLFEYFFNLHLALLALVFIRVEEVVMVTLNLVQQLTILSDI